MRSCDAASAIGRSNAKLREPDNRHDANAILILNAAADELGYVPREYAAEMAPLLDAGGWVEATVKKVIEARGGYTLPIIISTMYRQGVERPPQAPAILVGSDPKRVVDGKAAVSALLFGEAQQPLRPSPQPGASFLTPQAGRTRQWVAIAIVLAVALAMYLLTK
jgi:hypothetical protein